MPSLLLASTQLSDLVRDCGAALVSSGSLSPMIRSLVGLCAGGQSGVIPLRSLFLLHKKQNSVIMSDTHQLTLCQAVHVKKTLLAVVDDVEHENIQVKANHDDKINAETSRWALSSATSPRSGAP